MRTLGVYIVLSFFISIFNSCSLPADDDEESQSDDWSYKLPWSGETDKFTINAEEGIHLSDPNEEAGTAYITTPCTNIKNTRWEFGVRLAFNPSANNYARFYLASSSDNLSGPLYGYFIQIGGAKDNVALYRQNGNQPQLLASGRELMKGNNAPELYIKVECDNSGYWTFWTRLKTESEYTKEKQIKDNQFSNSICCGIYCVYTKTRSDGFTFHHLQISKDVSTTPQPDDHPEEPENPDNSVQPNYPEEVSNILLFNEVMYDNATNGAEYIEFYNPTNSTISVPSLKLLRYEDDGHGGTQTTTTAILQHPDNYKHLNFPPHGYVCFTKSAATLIKKHKVEEEGTIIEVAKFPQINNDGGYLAIVTNEEKARLIDKCCYSNSMHTNKKRNQGISLEKKSPELSSLNANWHSSTHSTGGTPGTKNSE